MKYIKWTLPGSFLIIVGWSIPEIFHDVKPAGKIQYLNPTESITVDQTEHELVLVYIGCASCSESNRVVLPSRYHNYQHAKAAIFEIIEIWYNRKRLHSALD